MPCCCVYGCTSGYKDSKDEHRMFSLPTSKARRRKWLEQISRANYSPKKRAHVCEVHFSEDSYIPAEENFDKQGRARKKRTLKEEAYPTLHLKRPRLDSDVTDLDSPDLSQQDHVSCLPHIDHGYYDSSAVDHNLENVQSEVEIHDGSAEQLSPEEVLQARVAELEAKNAELEAENSQLKQVVSAVKKIFHDDHLHKLNEPSWRPTWSVEVLQDAIKTYTKVGTSGYKFLRAKGYPYPSIRTLQTHLAKIDCQPGVLHDFFHMMKLKVDKFNPLQRSCTFVADEMAIKAKKEYNMSSQSFVGHPDVPAGPGLRAKRKKENIDETQELATHAMSGMLIGMFDRWMQLGGFLFTDNSFDPEAVAKWMYEIIGKATEIGLRVRNVTMDMGPCNRAL